MNLQLLAGMVIGCVIASIVWCITFIVSKSGTFKVEQEILSLLGQLLTRVDSLTATLTHNSTDLETAIPSPLETNEKSYSEEINPLAEQDKATTLQEALNFVSPESNPISLPVDMGLKTQTTASEETSIETLMGIDIAIIIPEQKKEDLQVISTEQKVDEHRLSNDSEKSVELMNYSEKSKGLIQNGESEAIFEVEMISSTASASDEEEDLERLLL